MIIIISSILKVLQTCRVAKKRKPKMELKKKKILQSCLSAVFLDGFPCVRNWCHSEVSQFCWQIFHITTALPLKSTKGWTDKEVFSVKLIVVKR